jgi:hypothetical protein
MMHFRDHGRISSLAWLTLMAALIVCYATIFAGIVGLVGALTVSLISFSGALIGCVAALVYLVAAMRDIHAHHGGAQPS